MSAKAARQAFLKVLNQNTSMGAGELRRNFSEAFLEWEEGTGRKEPSKGKPWSDDQLRVVLSDAPTKENCLKHARAFGRGYGAIEQIYRWATTENSVVKQKRPDDVFIALVKKVAKELGWRG